MFTAASVTEQTIGTNRFSLLMGVLAYVVVFGAFLFLAWRDTNTADRKERALRKANER